MSPDPARESLIDRWVKDGGKGLLTLNQYCYAENDPLRYIDPDGEKPVQSNILLGFFAHQIIERDFMETMRYEGSPRTEFWTPFGRPDMALFQFDQNKVKVWDIKPLSYKADLRKQGAAKAQLNKEIMASEWFGVKEYGVAVKGQAGGNYPGTTRYVFPNGASLNVEISNEGLVYYQWDDGKPLDSKETGWGLARDLAKMNLFENLKNFFSAPLPKPPGQTTPLLPPLPLPVPIPLP